MQVNDMFFLGIRYAMNCLYDLQTDTSEDDKMLAFRYAANDQNWAASTIRAGHLVVMPTAI